MAILVLLAVLVLGLVFARGCAHRVLEVDGVIHVFPPGPRAVELPAVACAWPSFSGTAAGEIASAPNDVSHESVFVLCNLPEDGVGISFRVTRYGLAGAGLTVGAFLKSVEFDHPSCGDGTILALVSDRDGQLRRLCEGSLLPAATDGPTIEAFDDEAPVRVNAMQIEILRAE
ncbi:MAG: hypothetical protein AAF997_18250 [Myxococcota bacterium]